jgi:hypothetical protein
VDDAFKTLQEEVFAEVENVEQTFDVRNILRKTENFHVSVSTD